tara:strand:+ start:237 stop:425 length:189 start_codon:yes stop_codon:yes gene_type:complete
MKIKPGDKLPQNDFFYLDDSNEVKKISTNDLFEAGKMIILGMPGAFTKTLFSNSSAWICKKL